MLTTKPTTRCRSVRAWAVIWLLSALTVLGLARATNGAEPPALTESEVKAGFVYNFARFVEWPATAVSGSNALVVIGVLGDDAFGSKLEQTLKDKVILGRPCTVRKYKELIEVNQCHLLFIGGLEKKRLPEILAALKDAPVLTVGEMDRFAQAGGMINLYKEQNSFRFEINLAAAERAQLKINPRLLQLARIVRNPKP
jgi:hypothetical protein